MSLENGSPAHGSRRRRRRLVLAVAALAALLVLAVPVAWASHQFTDVPDAHQFHTEIGAIRNAGITGGKTCVPPGTPPTYCPDEAVTRAAMAAFMHRGFGRAGTASYEEELTTTFETLAGGTLTMQAGGVPGGTGFLKIDASTGIKANTGEATCPCQAEFRILVDGNDLLTHSLTQFSTINTQTGFGADQTIVTGVVPVSTGAAHTIEVQADELDAGSGHVTGFGQMSALYVPLGSTGGSTLSASP
jgi:hypothetical protein